MIESIPIAARLIAGAILLPFVAAFVYAGVHEYRRYKSEGPSEYGLIYDEETGTTRVSPLEEGTESYDFAEYDPNDFNDPEVNSAPDEDTPDEDDTTKT
jgi:hypothetical protein